MKGYSVVVCSFSATIGSVRESELEMINVGRFIYYHEVVVVAELLDGWEVSVLLAVLDWHARFGVSEVEFVWKLILQHVSEDT